MSDIGEKIKQVEVEFLEGVLKRNYDYAQQLDTYASIMIALSSAIFIFSFSELREERSLFWMILGVATGIATIMALLIVRPPRPLRKRGQEESIMYSRRIIDYGSWQEYSQRLRTTLASRDEVINQYGKEIYNLTKYYYLPKKLLFKITKIVLLAGMSVSLTLFLLEYFLV